MAMARAVAAAAAMPLLVALLAAASAAALDFYVGGHDGWTVKPAEPYGPWAERNRFQVNDRLVFRYSPKDDAVLVVAQSQYDACNTTGPDQRLADGDSVYVLTRSGPHFFISGDAGRCRAGERLVVVVLAVRNYTPAAPSASPPPPPASSRNASSAPPPAKSPPHVPVPAPAPRAPASPPAARNASAPSPSSTAPAPAPAPGTNRTSSKPSHSSAQALRAGVLACLVIAGGAILV
ncbi:hypothetical protein ACP4OV_031396 [Aristida adscensionis]